MHYIIKYTHTDDHMELISGLPNDLARECLVLLPFESFPFLLTVSKAWNREIRSPDFHHRRWILGLTRPVFVLIQRDRVTHSFSIRLFDPSHQPGSLFTRLPNFPFKSPQISGVVGVGSSSIMVISRLWRRSVNGELVFVNAVHVFDFITGQWRRAADMPSNPDMWYGIGVCADPVNRKVLVVGGYGGPARALHSAVMYDVAQDNWMRLDDMEKGRQSASVVFNACRFHIIGGYSEGFSPNQMTCAESLDLETLRWGPINEGFLEENMSDNASVVQMQVNGDLYSVGQSVRVRGEGDTWEEVAPVPQEVWRKKGVVAWKDKMLVLGGEQSYARPIYNYLFDLNTREWSSISTAHGYSDSTLIDFGCGIDL